MPIIYMSVASASPMYIVEEEDLTLVHLVATRTAQAQTTQKVRMDISLTACLQIFSLLVCPACFDALLK